MTNIGWIVLVILLVPALALLLWVVLSASFVRVPPGRTALLLVRGRPTDTTLAPGPHFVPALRRRMVVTYPAVEMTYRAGGTPEPADQDGLDCVGDSVQAWLGDRVPARLDVTVRFRLAPDRIRLIHERFGPGGIFAIVRDRCVGSIARSLGQEDVGVDDLFGERREARWQTVADDLSRALDQDGIEVIAVVLVAVDLGRTGEVIAAASRAPAELAAEQAAAATRLAQASNDAELEQLGAPSWRYRETDLWRELVLRRDLLNVALQGGPRPADPPAFDRLPTTDPDRERA